MSTLEINKGDSEEDLKTPDKKQIEDEEKEIMLKGDPEKIEATSEVHPDNEGPVKAALSADLTEQGREVKPKFIPIGAIKMPGFFTRNSDKIKEEDSTIEKDNEKDESGRKPKSHRLQFLHTCPFTQFMHHRKENSVENETSLKSSSIFPLKYPKIFRKHNKDAEATLASMETLEDKLQTPNDGMENVKLDCDETDEGKVATRLPLKERIRQKKFIIDDAVVLAVALVLVAAVVAGVALCARAGPPRERPLRLGRYVTTVTQCGPLEGILDEGVYKFFSVPYAEPPVGALRFRRARALSALAACWNGTRRAHAAGPRCLQRLEDGAPAGAEDCLTLDVVTPHVRYDSPLPVVVLVGATSLAGGLGPAQPSALYARTKEVVFVRPNFRLGAFGFLALDILSEAEYPATSGNYGLSDLLTALQWIKYNIVHFGGDPESVTLLGHRAGATLVAALTTVPKAHKLYSRVWLSSPSVIFPGDPLKMSESNNEQFKQNVKCNTVECLRRVSSTEILSATPDVWLSNNMGTLPSTDEIDRSWLVLDGDLLRVHAYESWDTQKEFKENGKDKVFKPMVFGTSQHSGHSETLRRKHVKWSPEAVERAVADSAIGRKNLTAEVFAHFNKSYAGLAELISAVRTLCPLVSLARLRLGAPMYVVGGEGAGGGRGGSRLAGADADVQAILGTFSSDTPEQRRFMAAMQLQFYYFVWHGALPGPAAPLLAVAQDPRPLPATPACDLLIRHDLVPRYAHQD